MMKHTPGPWEIRHSLNVVRGNRGIAACGGYTTNTNSEEVEAENLANARLIAAAPDLLALAERISDYLIWANLDDIDGISCILCGVAVVAPQPLVHLDGCPVGMAKAALARVRGE